MQYHQQSESFFFLVSFVYIIHLIDKNNDHPCKYIIKCPLSATVLQMPKDQSILWRQVANSVSSPYSNIFYLLISDGSIFGIGKSLHC